LRLFGDNPFQPFFPYSLKQLFAVTDEVVGVLHSLTWQDNGGEQLPAVDGCGLAQIVPIQIEEIEGKESERLRFLTLEGSGTTKAGMILQQLKARDPVFIEGHNLAVHNRAL